MQGPQAKDLCSLRGWVLHTCGAVRAAVPDPSEMRLRALGVGRKKKAQEVR